MSFQPTWPRDVPELAGDVRQCTEGRNAGPLLGIFFHSCGLLIFMDGI